MGGDPQGAENWLLPPEVEEGEEILAWIRAELGRNAS